jgi:hypothetical protein
MTQRTHPRFLGFTILQSGNAKIAVVLVPPGHACPDHGDQLLAQLQHHLPAVPLMLVSRLDERWGGIEAYARFQHAEFVRDLMLVDSITWSELPEPVEPPLPF